MVTKIFFFLLISISIWSFAAVADTIAPNDFVFHKSTGTNAQWGIVGGKILQVKFAPGNPFNASLWFSRIIPFPKVGRSYRISITVKQSGVTDPQARINLDVIGGNRDAASLDTTCFRKTVWAANCAEWTTVELSFTLPEAGRDAKWNQAQTFLTSFSAISANGTFFFRDYKFEEVVPRSEATAK